MCSNAACETGTGSVSHAESINETAVRHALLQPFASTLPKIQAALRGVLVNSLQLFGRKAQLIQSV